MNVFAHIHLVFEDVKVMASRVEFVEVVREGNCYRRVNQITLTCLQTIRIMPCSKKRCLNVNFHEDSAKMKPSV